MKPHKPHQLIVDLEPHDTRHLATLCGQYDEHLRQIETRLGVHIANRGQVFQISGEPRAVTIAARVLKQLYQDCLGGLGAQPASVHLAIQHACNVVGEPGDSRDADQLDVEEAADVETIAVIRTKKSTIRPRGRNQQLYVRTIQDNDINFGIGPAGTGKTYLAVACAVQALLNNEVQRILLVRPAVEAGEKLGFLPGDLSQKIDPYLRPLYDALYEMLGVETVGKLIERNVIEIAPLAYMRGRTLNDAFIILDESQNTTREQMKMFLTRIGFGSTAVITGDATQIDLPRGTPSGLTHAIKVLENVDGIGFTYFQSRDVVRHPLVQRIVDAYALMERETTAIDKGHSPLDKSHPPLDKNR